MLVLGVHRSFGASLRICLATICLTLATGSFAIDVDCCPRGAVWQHSTNCSDGTPVRLKCPWGTYLVDPDVNESDNFTVEYEGNNAWFVQPHYDKLPAGRFCLATSGDSGKEIALVCFEEEARDTWLWRTALFCVLSIISAVFLVLTLAVYIVLPELREIQDKSLMAAITSLAVSYTLLSAQHLRMTEDGDDTICIALAFVLYYAFLSAFFWFNIVAFNIWRSVWFKNFILRDKALFIIYCVIGWGGPTCFLIAALTTHHVTGDHLQPGFGESSCWFAGVMQMWAYFYGPIAALLMLNTIYLGMTVWRLWHQYQGYSGSKLRVLRFRCLLCIKLILVTGITWIFEVMSFAVGTIPIEYVNYWLPTDILNALQGFVIFLLLVATRKRVRKLLAKKRPCGIGFPKSWVAYEDEECEAVLPEELELSQQG